MIKHLSKYLYLDSLYYCLKCKPKEEIYIRNTMVKRAPYKGNKIKVETLVKKMIEDNMYDPNEEELWLLNDYDRFGLYSKPMLKSFEKYYDKLWEELKKLRRMDIEVFEELVGSPNIYLVESLRASTYDLIDCDIIVAEKSGVELLTSQLNIKQ